MKLIVGLVLVGIVAYLASGRMSIVCVVYCFSALFTAVGLALIVAYFRRKHGGLLIMGVTYVASAILAMLMLKWWPLAGGYALVWAMRSMGLEPPVEDLPGIQKAKAAPPSANEEKN